MRILSANTAYLVAKDRDYNKKKKKRESHLEIKNDGISHSLVAQSMTTKLFVVIEYEEEISEKVFNSRVKRTES